MSIEHNWAWEQEHVGRTYLKFVDCHMKFGQLTAIQYTVFAQSGFDGFQYVWPMRENDDLNRWILFTQRKNCINDFLNFRRRIGTAGFCTQVNIIEAESNRKTQMKMEEYSFCTSNLNAFDLLVHPLFMAANRAFYVEMTVFPEPNATDHAHMMAALQHGVLKNGMKQRINKVTEQQFKYSIRLYLLLRLLITYRTIFKLFVLLQMLQILQGAQFSNEI